MNEQAQGITPKPRRSRAKPPPPANGAGLTILLAGGRRIEVQPEFDAPTFNRVVQLLEAR